MHRVLDLHDVGAEPREQLGGVGEGLHLLGRQHAHAVERLAEALRVGVGDVAESHGDTLGASRRPRPEPSERSRRLTRGSPRGIVSAGGYVPYRRLQRADIAATFGTGGGKGTRSVASYDEDTTTMGVAAARLALRGAGAAAAVDALWFPPPTRRTSTRRTPPRSTRRCGSTGDTSALDFGGAMRSGIGALRIALEGAGSTLVVSSRHPYRPTDEPRRVGGGDAAAALLVGDATVTLPVR